jgi:exodeoxyribonuclease VII large subunit
MEYILTVSEINKYLKKMLSTDKLLSNLWIRGELSNFKRHYSGHMYFTLKDENSVIRCVMFRTKAAGMKFEPENGMKVIINGYVSIYERDGQYQLYAEEMQPDGIGKLHIAFEQLKKKLEGEGLFRAEIKKKLPFIPESIGVVTSLTGAVIRDIINVIDRRFRNVNIKIIPVQVQGEIASKQIAEAIDKFNRLDCVDEIIIARGGGSLEELWAFNEEIVARSIYNSRIPVISAVGHETDYTISDFVADVRAPTPSAAAELAVPEKSILLQQIKNMNIRLKNLLQKNLNIKRLKYDKIVNSIVFKQPLNRINQERIRLDNITRMLFKAIQTGTDKYDNKLRLIKQKLESLSPYKIIKRGYGFVRLEWGKIVKSVKEVRIDDKLDITLMDGELKCKVYEINEMGLNIDGKE